MDQHRRLTQCRLYIRNASGQRIEIRQIADESFRAVDLLFQPLEAFAVTGDHRDPVTAVGEAASERCAGRIADTGNQADRLAHLSSSGGHAARLGP